MGLGHGAGVVRSGLVLFVDAANKKSSLKTVEVLVVAGGGAGAQGGGGAGGLIYSSSYAVNAGNTTVTVGAGGIATTQVNATSGGNSIFGTLTAIGGGRGSSFLADNASTGGSGGGGSADITAAVRRTGTSGQGFSGGISTRASYGGGGAGGGAGGVGKDSNQPQGSSGNGGDGGMGLYFPQFSTIGGSPSGWFGGGGAGGGNTNGQAGLIQGLGGFGGGGNGTTVDIQNGFDAVPNTGGGGGGCDCEATKGGSGGSGIVIVRYPGSQRATGGTVTFINGHTIHTFTTSGTFTPNGAPGNGTVWADFSNNGNSGIIMNGVVYNSANGGSFVFDGVDDKVSTNFKPSGPRSYFIWIKYNSLTHPSGYQLTGTQEGNAYNYIGIINGGNVYYYAGGNGGTISNSTLSPNVWCQQGFVLFPDGSRKVYTNGIEINSSAGSLGVTATAEFSIGCINNSYNVNGNISQVSVYNRALSATEIKQNFNATRGRYGV